MCDGRKEERDHTDIHSNTPTHTRTRTLKHTSIKTRHGRDKPEVDVPVLALQPETPAMLGFLLLETPPLTEQQSEAGACRNQ